MTIRLPLERHALTASAAARSCRPFARLWRPGGGGLVGGLYLEQCGDQRRVWKPSSGKLTVRGIKPCGTVVTVRFLPRLLAQLPVASE